MVDDACSCHGGKGMGLPHCPLQRPLPGSNVLKVLPLANNAKLGPRLFSMGALGKHHRSSMDDIMTEYGHRVSSPASSAPLLLPLALWVFD